MYTHIDTRKYSPRHVHLRAVARGRTYEEVYIARTYTHRHISAGVGLHGRSRTLPPVTSGKIYTRAIVISVEENARSPPRASERRFPDRSGIKTDDAREALERERERERETDR